MDYFISYTLGHRRKSGLAASKGTVVHKALELLAHKKLAIQNGYAGFADEHFGQLKNKDITPETATCLAYGYYSKLDDHHDWNETDLEDCTKWTNTAITINNGSFNPLNLKIIEPEKFFDLEIKEHWASYDYKLGDKKLKGNLRVRGTLDLTVETDDGAIELIDWKTGKKMDWAKLREKDFDKLRNDTQLRLYHWALRQLFPGRTIIISIVYINWGGGTTLFFDDSDYDETVWMLRRYFNRIRNTKIPKLKWPHWWCNKLCEWAKPLAGETQPFCHKVRDEILQIGIDKVTAQRCQDKTFSNYEGGGKRLEKLE